MAPTDTEVSAAMTLIETVMITLPIWLAGIKYYIDDGDEESGVAVLFPETITLLYVSLGAVFISASTVITGLGNDKLQASVYGLWIVYFVTGILSLRLVDRETTATASKVLLRFVIASAIILMLVSFGLLILHSV